MLREDLSHIKKSFIFSFFLSGPVSSYDSPDPIHRQIFPPSQSQSTATNKANKGASCPLDSIFSVMSNRTGYDLVKFPSENKGTSFSLQERRDLQ